jgi:DNA (cytosine-5)-methyltransferase 1
MTNNKNIDSLQSCQTPVTSSPFRVLNLYACLGGNRYKWDEVTNVEVTAVEWDGELAKLYQERFPNDKVIVADAHQYLLDHYQEFDFIWSSPPCPSHSRARFARQSTTASVYPDFKLYEEIVFLDNYFKGKYVVENVIPFYEPLISAKKRGRHLYWTNFNLPNELKERKGNFMEGKNEVQKWCEFHDYDFTKYKGSQRTDKIARNLVDYEAGKTILETAIGMIKKANVNQVSIFDDVA